MEDLCISNKEISEIKLKSVDNPICRRCGRKLKDPESIQKGFGKICYSRYIKETLAKPLFH